MKTCIACGHEIRWVTDYEIPHFVHVKLADIITCVCYDKLCRCES